MALTNSIQWRIRAGGNNANGAGYDATTSGALATTLTASLSSGATSMTVASATGWPSSGNYYVQIGAAGAEPSGGGSEIVLVTSGQGTTTWTITRAQLGTSALAFASGIAVTNELTRCNTAPWSGSTGTSTASTTFTAAAAGFNETVVGNVLYLASGTGATVGFYLVTGYTNSTTITLDRASGTYTNGAWKIGGASADLITRYNSSTAVPGGSIIYMRAGGSATVSSPDYPMTGWVTPPIGDANGNVQLISENGTAYVSSTGGMVLYQVQNMYIKGFRFIAKGVLAGYAIIYCNDTTRIVDCIIDQNGNDMSIVNGPVSLFRCELLSSVANSGSAGTYGGFMMNSYGSSAHFCNIHDCWGAGVVMGIASVGTGNLVNCIIANNKGDGIQISNPGQTFILSSVDFCTISGNGGNGITYSDATALRASGAVTNCIISNHTTAGKYGISCNFNSTAVNDRLRGMIGNNWFYNNTSNALNLTVGSAYGDSTGTDPQFAGSSVENYAIGANPFQWANYQFVNSKSSTTPPKAYLSPGGVQPNLPRFFGGFT